MAKSASDIDRACCDQVAALPWRIDSDGKLRVLLVTSRTNGKWMLPKGWPMSGKSAGQAAGIEAKQEGGVEKIKKMDGGAKLGDLSGANKFIEQDS